MSLYVFVGHDGPDGAERRNQHRQGHVAWLDGLDGAGRIAYAGPIRTPEDDRSVGAVIVIEAASLADAEAAFAEDPFLAGGVYERHLVAPFKKAYPKP